MRCDQKLGISRERGPAYSFVLPPHFICG